MFKNMCKRSWLSVSRKLGRSILIGLILFAMSNLILAAIIIKSAVNTSMDYAKASLGGTVSIQPDMSKLRSEFKNKRDEAAADTSSTTEPPKMERPSVTKTIADQIAASEYVKDYTYSISASANGVNLTAVETTNNAPAGMGDMGGRGPGNQNTTNTGDFTISGVNAYAYISAVKDDTMSITSGTYFNEENLNQVLISVDLAEANNLQVGSTITLTNLYTNTNVELTIIGIYDNSSERANANTIYMNVDTAAQFISETAYNNGDYNVSDVKYTLTNAAYATAFITWINDNFPTLAENNLTATEDTALYDQMVGPIESVGSFATTILIIVIIAAIIIITLIVMINVKDRRYEMGVLLSLGAKKINIIGQIFFELVIIGTFAFALSTVTATALAKTMGQGILDSQIASAQTESANNFGRPTGGPTGNTNANKTNSNKNQRPQAPGSNADVEVIDHIDINAQPSDFLLLFACGYGVILIALLLPSINVLRYQPKQILQGKE